MRVDFQGGSLACCLGVLIRCIACFCVGCWGLLCFIFYFGCLVLFVLGDVL